MSMTPQATFNTRKTTTWAIIVITLLLIGWDLYARQADGGTISEVILTWARAHPAVPYAAGVVCGHLFWPQVVKSE